MLLRKTGSLESIIRSSEITPERVFNQFNQNRRRFLAGAASLGAATLAARYLPDLVNPARVYAAETPLKTVPSNYTVPDAQTPFSKAINLQQLLRVRRPRRTSLPRTPTRCGFVPGPFR